jgi:hypothetical protein
LQAALGSAVGQEATADLDSFAQAGCTLVHTVTADEQRYLDEKARWLAKEGAY